MSKPKSNARNPSVPQPAIEAALGEKAGDPLRRALWLDALDRQLRPCYRLIWPPVAGWPMSETNSWFFWLIHLSGMPSCDLPRPNYWMPPDPSD